jgi:tetratricopeptide (TPR) repeat protein
MQFIEGQTLAALIRQLRQSAAPEERTTAYPPPDGAGNPAAATAPAARQATLAASTSVKSREHFRRVADWGVQAAEALDHAHQTGIVHRDVKPGNLMIDNQGHLWVTDFGLAHVAQGEASLTLTGDLVGTLRYMSPEQALAKRVVIDHRTDVYSLGVTLYELLTLEPAFAGDKEEVLRQIAFEEPKPPRRRNRAVPAELETIVLKAMEKNPQDRYATAKEMADDMRRFLEDKPIRARRPSWRQVAMKWARRHQPLVGAAVAVLLVAMTLGAVTGLWWTQKRAGARASAQAALDEATRLGQQERWPEAISAVKRAGEVLAGVGANADLEQQVEDLGKDLEMGQKLQEARLAGTAVKKGSFDGAAIRKALAGAFKWYGLNVTGPDARAVGTRIQDSPIRAQLVAALDEWAYLDQEVKGTDWKPLVAVCRAADPDPWRDRLRDAIGGKNPRALTELVSTARSEDLTPVTAVLLARLARTTVEQEQVFRLLRKMRHRYPDDFWLNQQLGLLLLTHVRPAHPEEAISYLMAAVTLRPRSPGARLNLGVALDEKGQHDDAIEEYRAAILLKGDYASAHYNLGGAWMDKGLPEEAFPEFQEASRLEPNHAGAHYGLGNIWKGKDKLDQAILEYQEAIRLNPDFAEAYCNLSSALRRKGQFEESLKALRRGHELGTKRTVWKYPSGEWLREAERLVELDRRLPAFLQGQKEPADADECLALAKFCHNYKQLYAAAARWHGEAFAAKPELYEDLSSNLRYNAARCAALAGCGQGADAKGLYEEEQTGLRQQALAWSRAEMKALHSLLNKGTVKARTDAAKWLHDWLVDANFAGVREQAALARLPEAERAEWQKLWADVAATLARAEGKAGPEKKAGAK